MDQLEFGVCAVCPGSVIDYDYTMALCPAFRSRAAGGGKQKMTKDELLGLTGRPDARFMNEREDIAACHPHLGGRGSERGALYARVTHKFKKGKRQRRAGSTLPPATNWPPPRCKALWTASCSA